MLERNKKWMTPTSQLPTKIREKQVAKRMQGKPVPASGATPWAKEDLTTDLWLVQHKQMGGKSHTLHIDSLRQLRRHAIQVDKRPLYMLEHDEGDSFYIINKEQFNDLEQYYNDL